MAAAIGGGVRCDEEYVRSASGERIFARRYLPAGGPPVALAIIVHGLGEHSGFYHPVTRYFLSRGLAVYAHDHRGFGQSDGRRGHIVRYEHYADDLRAMVDRARSTPARRSSCSATPWAAPSRCCSRGATPIASATPSSPPRR